MTHRSRMRVENSLLRSKFLNEPVALTGGENPAISFGDLVAPDEHRLPSLATALNLPPGGEDSELETLNNIFRHLGVSCTGLKTFSLLIHRVTLCTLTDPLSGDHSIREQLHADAQRLQPWVKPVEAPLYIFLAYLTMFVYSSVVL